MPLTARPVTDENRQQILALHVGAGQEGFIETVAQCLAEADTRSNWRTVGIYNGETPVGFAMYGLFSHEGTSGRVWLDRFLIDARYQGRHFGEEALCLMLDRLYSEYKRPETFLSLYENNEHALALYKKHGFEFNGELDCNGELIMVRKV